MSKILLIDDEKTILDNLRFILELEGYEVLTASEGRPGIALLKENKDIAAIVTDMKMPGMSGLDVLREVRGIDPDIGIIVLTGNGDMENAVQAMKEGAYDYLNKPLNADKLIISIENAIKKLSLVRENRELNREVMRKNNYFQYINDAAQQILLRMIPKRPPQLDSLKLSVIYQSCDNVGGDMYDVFEMGDRIIFYIFDVCGHGILSAVMTMVMKSSFNSVKYIHKKTGGIPGLEEIIGQVNREMCSNTASNLFATLFAGIYDKKTRELTYASAGHVDQYLAGRNGIIPLSSTNTVIGIFDDLHFDTQKIVLDPGDRIYLFTDGITEIWHDDVINTSDEIVRIITQNRNLPVDENVKMIYGNLTRLYKDRNPDDDITLMGIEFN